MLNLNVIDVSMLTGLQMDLSKPRASQHAALKALVKKQLDN
jgi:hypothetical protein